MPFADMVEASRTFSHLGLEGAMVERVGLSLCSMLAAPG